MLGQLSRGTSDSTQLEVFQCDEVLSRHAFTCLPSTQRPERAGGCPDQTQLRGDPSGLAWGKRGQHRRAWHCCQVTCVQKACLRTTAALDPVPAKHAETRDDTLHPRCALGVGFLGAGTPEFASGSEGGTKGILLTAAHGCAHEHTHRVSPET